MPDRDRPEPQTPPTRLADLAELLGGDSARSRRFLGGLAIGALAGAALAGSIARRRRAQVPRPD
jgi:hypothetical protein